MRSPLCKDCGRRKGKKQINDLRCFTCARTKRQDTRTKAHADRVLATYGITGEQYRALLEHQGGRCYICRRATGRTKRLAVDHDHKKGCGHGPKFGCSQCVRGLLCSQCNHWIGWIKDNPAAGFRVASYLEEPPFQEMQQA